MPLSLNHIGCPCPFSDAMDYSRMTPADAFLCEPWSFPKNQHKELMLVTLAYRTSSKCHANRLKLQVAFFHWVGVTLLTRRTKVRKDWARPRFPKAEATKKRLVHRARVKTPRLWNTECNSWGDQNWEPPRKTHKVEDQLMGELHWQVLLLKSKSVPLVFFPFYFPVASWKSKEKEFWLAHLCSSGGIPSLVPFGVWPKRTTNKKVIGSWRHQSKRALASVARIEFETDISRLLLLVVQLMRFRERMMIFVSHNMKHTKKHVGLYFKTIQPIFQHFGLKMKKV